MQPRFPGSSTVGWPFRSQWQPYTGTERQRRGKLRAASTKRRHVSQSYKVRREVQDLVEIETRLGMPGGEGCHLTGSVKS